MNKKSQLNSIYGMLLLVGFLAILVFVGFLFAFGSTIFSWMMNILTPELSGLGMVGNSNMTQISGIVLDPISSIASNMVWFGGVIYILGIIGILALAFIYRSTMQKWLIPLFFGLMIILIIICIFMSNIYESLYTGTDELATGLQDQALLSWLILYSPGIMALIGFIGGAIMFSGSGEET